MKNKALWLLATSLVGVFLLYDSGVEKSDKNNDNSFVETTSLKPNLSTNLQQISSCVFRFSCSIYKDEIFQNSWESHCFVYANRGEHSFIALPRHCFSYDKNKTYKLTITDAAGKTTELDFERAMWSTKYDAEILLVKKISAPTLSSMGFIADKKYVGDSAILLSIFNARNVIKKIGVFLKDNDVKMNTFHSESGDSGALVIGRNGVVGVHISSKKNIEFYVPISVFEDLYIDLL